MLKRSSTKVVFASLLALLFLPPSISIQAHPPAYAQGSESECWAVIIGVADYQYIDDLWYCDDNAQDLYEQLAPIWGEDHVKLLVNSEATKANIEDAICHWLGPREDEDDVVLFFFSGHGLSEYLAPYDALTYSYANDIRSGELDSWLDALDSNKVVVILETCHAGSFLNDLSGSGRVILAACEANEGAWEARALEHAVFFYWILDAFDNLERADTNGDYEISAEEIFCYASFRTTLWEDEQHPVLDDSYDGELALFVMATFDTSPRVISLTIDGTTYSPEELPTSFLWLPGSVHDCHLPPLVSSEPGTQYIFNSWSDGNTSPSRTISQGGEYTANYVTQYYLTVESDSGDPQGEGWYDSGSTATISVSSPRGVIIRQVFTDWSGDSTATTSTATITMNQPKAVTANWRTDYIQLYILIGGIAGLAGVVSASVLLIRRRGKAPPEEV